MPNELKTLRDIYEDEFKNSLLRKEALYWIDTLIETVENKTKKDFIKKAKKIYDNLGEHKEDIGILDYFMEELTKEDGE
jgi:hypothetical protein